jgi:hypothetical protein
VGCDLGQYFIFNFLYTSPALRYCESMEFKVGSLQRSSEPKRDFTRDDHEHELAFFQETSSTHHDTLIIGRIFVDSIPWQAACPDLGFRRIPRIPS